MDKNNYSKAEDFILDDSFFHYVIYNEDPNNTWDIFIKENPALLSEINAAIKLIKYLNSANKLPIQADKREELTKLLQTINQQTKPVKLPYRLLKYAAAILILISSIYIFNIHDLLLYRKYFAENENINILLPDSSNIDLRKGSYLQVSRFYQKQNRNVKLNGEAFFKVHRNEKSKFNVQLNTCKVTVLGTVFNINSMSDSTVVTVKEGKISFQSDKTGETAILTKNMSAVCNILSEIETREFNINDIGWSTGEFHFNNQSLSHILKQLESYYPVHFRLNKKYTNKNLSFYVSNMELDEVLELLKQIIPGIEFERENKTVIIK